MDKVRCHNRLVEILGTAGKLSGAVAVGGSEVEDAATGGEGVVLSGLASFWVADYSSRIVGFRYGWLLSPEMARGCTILLSSSKATE